MGIMSENQLVKLTKKLIELNQSAIHSYNHVRETKEQGDFFTDVKPFADQVKEQCERWLPLATKWVDQKQPKHLHAVQLKNTSENLQMVSVKAFYPDTSLKRFKSHVQSVDYVLKRFLEEVQNNSEKQ